MVTLRVKRAQTGVFWDFEEKLIKYTVTSPTIIWAEHPACDSRFYMKRKMLLDNCDKDLIPLLTCIMEK